MTGNQAPIPDHLKRWPGLYVRQGDRIVEAPPEDIAIARRYPEWENKGVIVNGRRLTIMALKTSYSVNEPIRVIHIVEAVEPGYIVYIMGPKPVFGEYLDGRLATSPPPAKGDPLVPSTYNGAVLPSPAVDYNYEITIYSIASPGTHRIQWKLVALESNILTLDIIDASSAGNIR